ncbi:receptor-like protein Cf-9 homolog [Nicotiana sylvestris]|uniref:receptor-like protein Cf-9 homolog n=1 Tax=Nicotiana sylvestris TaxID=4096 RepID=UPI00388C6AFA
MEALRYLGDRYYQDYITVATKGVELELVRILTVYTAIDLLSNRFERHNPINELARKIPEQLASQLISLEVLNLSYNNLEGCISQGPQFATFQKNSYEGNDRLHGFPISKGCGKDRVSETNNTVSMLDDQESTSEFLNDFWKTVLMGYGSGLIIGLSIVYFMLSARTPNWLSWIVEELEHKITVRRQKKQRARQRHNRKMKLFASRGVKNSGIEVKFYIDF